MKGLSPSRRHELPAILVAALLVAAGLSEPARADAWRFYGSAGLSAGQADNPTQSDPNAAAAERKGAISGALTLTSGVKATWARTDFDVAWSPQTYFYVGRSDLNAVSHSLASSWKHAWSPAASLELTEALQYTPENEVDPNSLALNAVQVQRNRRTNSNFRGHFDLQAGSATTLIWRYSWSERAFSASNLIDTADHNAGFEWRRRIARGHSIFSVYEYGIFSFKGQAPGSDRHASTAGWGYESRMGITLSLAAGYNILLPDDRAAENASGLNVTATTGYNGGVVSWSAGYRQGISDGGGAFPNAQSTSMLGTLRTNFTKNLSADVAVAGHVNERIRTTGGTPQDETIRSVSSRAQVSMRLGQHVAANAAWTRHAQSVASGAITTPATDLRANRYAIGLTWSTR